MRIIGYIRVSSEEQAVSGLGLEAQEKVIRDTVRARPGWKLAGQIVRDEGESAGTLQRPGLRRALTAIANDRADGLIVAKLDRLSRSTVDFGLLLEWFREGEKTLVALDLGVDTSTAAGEMVASVMMSIAQWERSVNGERTKAALAALRAQGHSIGRPAVADDQALTERIRHMHAPGPDGLGMTLQGIADRLNAEHVPTIRGATLWRKSSIQSAAGYRRPKPRRKPADLPVAARR